MCHRLSEVVNSVAPKKIPAEQKYLILDVNVEGPEDENGIEQEVELPYVMVDLRK